MLRRSSPLNLVFVTCFFLFAICSFADEMLIDKEVTVIRGDFKELHYLIPDKTVDSEIQGSFTCKGGFADDINFLILTKDQYVRWYSNYSYKAIVKYEKKTSEKFQFPVAGGETYYFVFDNFFSTVSNKQVKLQVKLVPTKKE